MCRFGITRQHRDLLLRPWTNCRKHVQCAAHPIASSVTQPD
jgi:hypothetical protein